MKPYTTKKLSYAAAASALVLGVVPLEQNAIRPTDDMGWVVSSEPHVDLWYHGLATVGLDQDAGLALYSPGYVARVRAAKQELGIYPTELDQVAEELREGFEADRVFQSLHFLPLFFPTATPDQMLRGLRSFTDGSPMDSGAVSLDTGVGLGFAVAAFASEGPRELLGRFVEVLQQEWDSFFQEYWADSLSVDLTLQQEIQSEWEVNAAEPLRDYLNDNNLDSGRIFVSRVMGLEGRSVEENRQRGRENAVVVWAPQEKDAKVSVSAAVREMCLPLVDGQVIDAGTRNGQDPQTVASRAAVRCGALLLNRHNPEFLPQYEAAFLAAVDEQPAVDDRKVAFEQAYAVAPDVVTALRAKIEPAAIAAARATPVGPHWSVQTRPQVDLWIHGLATIGMVEGDLLPKYSAEYAAAMSQVKEERNLGPTPLDSLADYFKSEFEAKREFRALDQISLYFPDATPEQMLRALEAVADRQTYRTDKVSPEAAIGAALTAQLFNRNNLRRVLRRYVAALKQEWELFYGDYWNDTVAADTVGRAALNDFWQVNVAPRLGDFLTDRWLDGGTILVSEAIGPEGRLSIGDPSGRNDNVVVVWSPPGASPRDPAYYVIKEICHSVVTSALEDMVKENEESQPLRTTAAIRCGALIVDSYAPILSAGYRRAMMRAVGADSAVSTNRRFEERFALEPEILGALRDEIGGR